MTRVFESWGKRHATSNENEDTQHGHRSGQTCGRRVCTVEIKGRASPSIEILNTHPKIPVPFRAVVAALPILSFPSFPLDPGFFCPMYRSVSRCLSSGCRSSLPTNRRLNGKLVAPAVAPVSSLRRKTYRDVEERRLGLLGRSIDQI